MKKTIQRQFYNLLSMRWGMLLLFVGVLVTLNSSLQLLNFSLKVLSECPPTGEQGGDQELVDFAPWPTIDIVYTWVNGSDPIMQHNLRQIKIDAGLAFANETEIKDKDAVATASRFQDNDELLYSLRSIEKFAPWVRHIFIVTNGQVPNWLDLSNPRITLIPHSEIYPNTSHLPVFSSPSIESHLHQIPGLAEHFIYLNDDVMFGNQIFPEHFYNPADGYKVYLSWPVPNCNDGCPSNWIGDGYCDMPCNVSSCSFDGGDCANTTNTNPSGFGGWWGNYGSSGHSNAGGGWGSDRSRGFCTRSCPDNWIGDRYCDRGCQVAECGFDAGDCGVEQIYSTLRGIELYNTTEYVTIDGIVDALYINLTNIVGNEGVITDGSHDNSVLVRTATISQRFKVMTLTFHRDQPRQDVQISISSILNGTTYEKNFNLSIETALPQNNETDAQQQQQEGGGEQQNQPQENQQEQQDQEQQDQEQQNQEQAENVGRQVMSFEEVQEVPKETRKRGRLQIIPGDDEYFPSNSPRRPDELIRSDQLIDFADNEPTVWPWSQPNAKELNEVKGRQLMDMFGESLKHVDRLLNREFGFYARKVPAHMPHMINRRIMADLQAIFPDEYEKTSSNRLRSADDMQFAFSYFYYVIHAKTNKTVAEVFEQVDADHNNVLNLNELRTLAVRTMGTPLDPFRFNEFICYVFNISSNCSEEHRAPAELSQNNQGQVFENNNAPVPSPIPTPALIPLSKPITLELLENSTKVVEMIGKNQNQRNKYKTSILGTDDVAFIMINENDTRLENRLDGIRREQQRFICLNDDIDHSSPNAPFAVELLHNFYNSLFPLPSSFELPPGKRNEFLYIDEIRAHNEIVKSEKTFTYVGIAAALLVLFCWMRRKSQATKASDDNQKKKRQQKKKRSCELLNV